MCTSSSAHQENPTKALDGTEAVKFNSGAIRSSTVPPYYLIPFEGMRRLALRYELGAKKYVRDNWKKGLGEQAWIDQLQAHMAEHMFRYFENPEDKDDNLAAVVWGAFALMEAEKQYPEGRPGGL